MRHFIIGSALLMFVALDVIFVQFSETPPAALVFAVLCYFILRLLIGAAGGIATGTALQLNSSIRRISTISAVFLPVISLAALLGINERLIGLDPPVALGLAAVLSILIGGILAMMARGK